jgi:bifunctional non-homologous end joining protein LigD
MLPQLLNEISEEEVSKFINDDNFCGQEKFDGRRRILQYSNGKTIGYNKKGIAVGYPSEIEGACRSVAEVNGIKEFVLDGEEIGETYYVFDLLSLNGEDLRSQGYGSRYRKIGKQVWAVSDSIQVVWTAFSTAEKRDLYNRLKKENREGIVFKRMSGVHRSGYSDDLRKFKFTFTASVIVTGHHKTKNSLSMGVMDGDKLIPVGNLTMIGHEKPSINSIIEVKALYFFPGGSLYQPRFIGVRDDVLKEDCQLSKLKCKAVIEEE